jgi:hypothetical protein
VLESLALLLTDDQELNTERNRDREEMSIIERGKRKVHIL